MGKLLNMGSAKVSGNAGAWNFRIRGGQIVQASRSYSNKSKGNGASMAQRAHRCKLANFVNLYRHFKPIMKGAFGTLPANMSEFNYFVKKNLTSSDIYLTRAQANAGVCAAYNYLVAEGPLPQVNYSNPNFAESPTASILFPFNIPSGTLSENYTVGQFSTAFIEGNPGYANGDCVIIFVCGQGDGAASDMPRFQFNYSKIVLNTSSAAKLSSALGVGMSLLIISDGLTITGPSTDGSYECGVGCFVTRGSGSSMVVSTCYMAAPEDLGDFISSRFPRDKAMDSYGFQDPILISAASE